MKINNHPVLTTDISEPQNLISWINHQNSLTDKLQAHIGDINLELLFQGWTRPGWWENYLLDLKEGFIFQREIMMKSKGFEYWYARSIIPQSCYNLEPDFFNRLEKESIRNLIFGNDNIQRVTMTSYPVDKQCLEYYWVKKYINPASGTLWVRFAEFKFRNLESFYLMEILLPELMNLT